MSWQQLIDIYHVAAEEREIYRTQPPVACPNDGEPLDDAGNGILHCRFDGWQYPRDWVQPC